MSGNGWNQRNRRATAIALARRGGLVAVVGRDLQDAEAKQTIEALKATGQRTLVIRGDMGNAGDCRACVEQTAAQLGPVDVLIHSAGGLVAGGLFEVSEESWMKGFDVHVHAVFHLCRAVVPAMKKKGEGAIILISSSAGKLRHSDEHRLSSRQRRHSAYYAWLGV